MAMRAILSAQLATQFDRPPSTAREAYQWCIQLQRFPIFTQARLAQLLGLSSDSPEKTLSEWKTNMSKSDYDLFPEMTQCLIQLFACPWLKTSLHSLSNAPQCDEGRRDYKDLGCIAMYYLARHHYCPMFAEYLFFLPTDILLVIAEYLGLLSLSPALSLSLSLFPTSRSFFVTVEHNKMGEYHENVNEECAYLHFAAAASSGDKEACYKMGMYSLWGFNVATIHHELAMHFLWRATTSSVVEIASRARSLLIQCWFGHYKVNVSSKRMVRYLLDFDPYLDDYAKCEYALHLSRGDCGLKKSFVDAQRMFAEPFHKIEEMAKSGDVRAQYAIGWYYSPPFGVTNPLVTRNPERAVHWWLQAAKRGHAHAQWRLAETLRSLSFSARLDNTPNGDRVAHYLFWYRAAATQKVVGAALELVDCLSTDPTSNVEEQTTEARQWSTMCAELGHKQSQIDLRRHYLRQGDDQRAKYWDHVIHSNT